MKIWVLLREKRQLTCETWRRGDGCMNGGGIHEFTRRKNTRGHTYMRFGELGRSPGTTEYDETQDRKNQHHIEELNM